MADRNKSCGKAVKAAVIILIAGFLVNSRIPAQTVITVDSSKTYQTMTGWEVTPVAWETYKLGNKFDSSYVVYKDRVLDTLVNALGINRVRLEIRSGMENPVDYFTPYLRGIDSYTTFTSNWYNKVNDNSDPNTADPAGFNNWGELDWQVETNIIPMQALLAARNEKLYINVCYVDFGGGNQGTLSHATNPAEFAELVSEAFKHLKSKYNITPDAFEICLEPENTASAIWHSGNIIGKAILAVVPRLNAAGFFPKEIIAPSCTNLQNSIYDFNVMKNNFPAAVPKMTTLSYHRYGGVTQANLQTLANLAQTYGLMSAMSEWLNADINTLMEDLTLVNVSFWQQWGLCSRANTGKFYLWADLANPTNPIIHLSTQSNGLRQFFKYIRMGAVRISAASSDVGLYKPAAFRNTNGKHVVVVNNRSASPFTVTGLPAGTYGITYSSATANNVSLPDVTIGPGGTLTAHGGDSGAVTLYGKSAGTSGGTHTASKAEISLKIFPNPFSNRVTFLINRIGENEKCLLEIYDVAGQKVRVMSTQASGRLTLNKDGLCRGTYIYKVYSNSRLAHTGKLLLL